jgi:Spy/CpxP family protein refolding chaperone
MIVIATSRTRLLGAGLLAAVFVAGGLAGAAVHQVGAATDPSPAGEERGSEHECRARFSYLNLTPEQRARVDAVFAKRKQQLDGFWEANGARYRTIVDSARSEFRNVLSPDQIEVFDRRRTENEAREDAEREKRRQREQECAQRQQQNGEATR